MEKTEIAKYTMKDSVFTNLFQEKRYLIQLYRALHPEDELKDITMKNVLVDACYNDLGFMVGDKIMILTEAQSTWTMNIIIRSLLYLAQSYHEYFERRNDNLYGSKKVKVPKPELYVIFIGKRVSKPEYVSLSEECTLGISLIPAFTADFPPNAHKFNQRTIQVRLLNLCTSDKKSSRKIRHKENPRVQKMWKEESEFCATCIHL